MLKYLLFDLDHTLYSSRYGLEDDVRRRIMQYNAAYLGLSVEDAWKERADKAHIYGTNLEWLLAEKNFTDVEGYFATVHPKDEADALPPDPDLRKFLEGIPIPKAVLTNSPREHADLILGKLGFEGLFTHIIDVRLTNFIGKPSPLFFNTALDMLNVKIEDSLFIDDVPRYIEKFIQLGGRGILYDEKNLRPDFPCPRILRLEEIVAYLD
jgi:putative hydrolase of the HAD superfamily